MRQSLPILLVAALAAFGFLAGCGSSTDPVGSPQFFSGEISFQGRAFHSFAVTSTGTIRVEMVRLQEKVVEGEQPIGLPLRLGMGVGRPSEDQCLTRTSLQVQEGGVLVLGLTEADFCVLVFDGGTLFSGQVAEYTVSVSSG